MKIKAWKDFWAGLMFISIGLIFAIGANNYPMGTAVRMGPAYFPSILGWITVALGAIVFFESFVVEGEQPRKIQFRRLFWILGAVAMFGLLVGPLNGGLVAACITLIVMAAAGGDDFRWKEVISECVILVVATVLIFVQGLGLPFRLWPGFIGGA